MVANGVARGQKLRVAIIGQSAFAAEVYKLIKKDGHKVVGVFTVPDNGNREDPAASVAAADKTPVFKIKSWRRQGAVVPEVLEQYLSVEADLNVLPFCTQFIPMEVINHPKHKSICYHPSILPKHRGVSSINWTLIEGDTEAGFTVFWADDGLDTGPILLQRRCAVEAADTVDSLYNKFMYPEGIKAMAQAVNMVADGTAPATPQPEEGASYEPSLKKKELTLVQWDQPAERIHNFIRGLDSSPGAVAVLAGGEEVRLFGSSLWPAGAALPQGDPVAVEGAAEPALVHDKGLLLLAGDGARINVERLHVNGRMMPASRYGKAVVKAATIEMTAEEKDMLPVLRGVWGGILRIDIEDETDFFASGAGSMDVVRLVEEVKDRFNLEMQNEDVFMATTFAEFCQAAVLRARGGSGAQEVEYDAVLLNVNNLSLRFPRQLFIDGRFVDAEGGRTIDTINPADETVICKVQRASPADVDRAVRAAQRAFSEGEWSRMSARDRGRLLFRLADLMEEHKQELATLEAVDSGAVYTLALKTHVGMSIDVWRYFAGWCDKITGSTIPISHARPNRNLTFTRKEPIGVCGLVTPWNYPLMMLSWKMAACLAAGNTVVMKPAQVSPLTALKFAELSAKAGIPPGVINIVPGTGSEAGHAIATHPLVRKLGFTGSTEVGQTIMRSCADSNLKKVSLELGGKSPLVIFDDCDLDRAVRNAMSGVFFNKGENCIAAGRLFVQDTIHDTFVERVIEETKKMVIGDPLNRSTHHGPQNHKAHLDKLVDYVGRGVAEGASLCYGGQRLPGPGLYFQPAVLTNVQDHMYVAKEESFGPIMIISKFSGNDLDAVIKRANNTEFGLASGVFTRDIGRAMAFAEKIDAGTVFINTYNKTDVAAPFGGFKQSGFGKDLGEEALNEYLKTKCVTLEY